jgi:hypothetical protein
VTDVKEPGWVGVPEYTPSGKVQFAVTSPLNTRRGFWTFAALTWALAMLGGVAGVGLFMHESLGGFVFAACLLTLAVAFWLWILRRLTR